LNPRYFIMLAGVAAIVWASHRWRQAVQAALVLLIFEGAIRKWLFPSSQDLVYFAKDVVLLGAYVGYLLSRDRERIRVPPMPLLKIALGFTAALGLLEMFNPHLPNIMVGAFGFKAYFYYIPLFYLIPAVFPTDEEMKLFLRRYALIAIPVGLLGIAQFFSPASSALNTYARSNDMGEVITFGSSAFVRVTSTFSFITGYNSYLLSTAILLLALLGEGLWRFRKNLGLFAAFGMAGLGMMMTGSRGPVFILAAILPLYWWLGVVRERGGVKAAARLLIGGAIVGALLSNYGGEAMGAFQGRASGGLEDVFDRITLPFRSPFLTLSDAGLGGYGIGATHQTASALARDVPPYSWLDGLIVEVESGRVMLELGPIGFFLVYFIRIYLILFSFRQVFRLRTRFHRAIAVSCFLYFLAQLPGTVIFDVTSGLFFWFYAGLLAAAIRLDREAARVPARATAAAAAGAVPLRPARPSSAGAAGAAGAGSGRRW
jgi:hypothetical protein